ncbi:helix-turn-helix domain-containing protein [Pasteurella multocida subsp. multocida]|uniref:Helix-turn-helix domain-containing protein n=1 Tax=Pasteurella multocida TaxID=747 RepID=A0A9X3UMB8_PASMD|nr:S24 family peptidase [Pasteurella multocida]MBF6979489.1 helix-turn-helix domain-containing protein [Pasteurella multocida]MDA5611819.1 helix-turn-helix domain-containing protein [Pasteurella multocida]MDA5614287.1 helix-turn-helix domain-containing protein [Pasteurella multocida]MDA5619243.1 helix-turn-helix domain-containing protein [Pasteurella multocida subsp. multocida]MDA5621913.1 helix-turn-helix domain-containing protein [Pasteurella multocida subsp. multocida]
MKTLSERLLFAMQQKGLNQAELASMSGTSQVTISNILNGITDVPRKGLEIANALDVSLNWLLNGIEDGVSISGKSGKTDSIVMTLLDNRLAAGNGVVNLEYPDAIRSIEFSPEKFMELFQRKTASNISMAIIDGNSMYDPDNEEISLKHGDIVFIDKSIQEFKNDGIYAFVFEGQARIKRLQYMSGYRLKVISDNPTYETEILEKDQVQSIHFIGKLIKKLPMEMLDL